MRGITKDSLKQANKAEREREREEFPGNRGTTIIEKPTSVSISPATF